MPAPTVIYDALKIDFDLVMLYVIVQDVKT